MIEGAGAVESTPPVADYTPAIYGSILVTTLLAIEWNQVSSSELIALSLVISVAVFWLTHVWSEVVNRRVRGPIDPTIAVVLARREATMLTAVVVPGLVLASARLTGSSVDTVVQLALAVSIVQLFLWGLAVGRAAHDSWAASIVVALVDCGLGLLIVALKILVIH
ncbi:MAG: hypothetical protein ACJ761_11695 [Chloroflexota bacterium]